MHKFNFWEIIGYITLGLCLIGQVTVGKWYIFAQSAYLIANLMGIIRDFKLHLPPSNCVRDIVFAVITILLIGIKIISV